MIAALSCKGCGHEFENIQKYEEPNPDCPECGGESERHLARTHFRCIGGGWHADSYATVTKGQKELQRRMKDAVSGRYRPDGKTVRSALRGY